MGADMHGPCWGIGHVSGSAMLLVPDNGIGHDQLISQKHIVFLACAIITGNSSKIMPKLHDHYTNSFLVKTQRGRKMK